MSMRPLSPCGVTAVDIDRLAGDKTRRGRREKDQNANHVLDLAEPADGGPVAHPLIKLRLGADELPVEVSDDDGRADRVHGNAGGTELERKGGTEIRQTRFACTICRSGRHAAAG